MLSPLRLATLAAGLSLLAAPALAAAPQPSKPVSPGFFSGRWYEIARTPNLAQKDCEAPSTQFTGVAKGGFTVVQTCHKGSAAGPTKVFNSKGARVADPKNAKFKMSFLGGLKTQEYWIVDRADDANWAVMATPGGNYVWLLSRSPNMSSGARNSVVSRIRALGFDTAKLVFPKQN